MSDSPIERFVNELDETELTDLVVIVAQQDPTESKAEGGARWNAEQRDLILAAQKIVDEAGLGD